jgi:7,8-dihydroneopterin aldolase/epimerase/oxygenase
MDNLDYLEVKDIVLMCRLGVTDAEQAQPQKVFITLRIFGDFQRCMESDNIKDTVDYVCVVSLIEALVQDKSFHLIERLAHEIRETILSVCVDKFVEVHVMKPNVLRNARHAMFVLHV